MKTHISDNSVTIWFSANDTYKWANRPRQSWPCSTLAGRRLPDKKAWEALRPFYTVTSSGIFGADAWKTSDGSVNIAKICPQIGGVGWARYPGADHWQATDASGRVILRTQNYGALLRWFFLKLRKAPAK